MSNSIAHTDAIKTEYGIFHEMAQQQIAEPLMAHLFAESNASYRSLSKQVRQATSGLSPADRVELLVKERAVAHFVFTSLEETYFLSAEAKDSGVTGRARLLEGDLKYFDHLLCRNPRLRWYWSSTDGGGMLQLLFAQNLQDYEETALQQCRSVIELDDRGPFGDDTGQLPEDDGGDP